VNVTLSLTQLALFLHPRPLQRMLLLPIFALIRRSRTSDRGDALVSYACVSFIPYVLSSPLNWLLVSVCGGNENCFELPLDLQFQFWNACGSFERHSLIRV
jgi:hypothetical protein